MPTHKEHLRDLLRTDDIAQFLKELLEATEQNGQSSLNSNLTLQSAAYYGNENQLKKGIISQENYALAKARIRYALDSYLEEYKEANIVPIPNAKNKPNKQKILDLLDKDIDAAFEELDKSSLANNSIYSDLINEYISRPNNFSLATFRSRLKVFVRQNME